MIFTELERTSNFYKLSLINFNLLLLTEFYKIEFCKQKKCKILGNFLILFRAQG